jgi:hypothetical protein
LFILRHYSTPDHGDDTRVNRTAESEPSDMTHSADLFSLLGRVAVVPDPSGDAVRPVTVAAASADSATLLKTLRLTPMRAMRLAGYACGAGTFLRRGMNLAPPQFYKCVGEN